MNSNYYTFENTLAGLSRGLHIRHIATDTIQTCTLKENVLDVLGRHPEFDQFPVVDEQRMIGVLERNGQQYGVVADHMRQLDDSILVTADEPLLNFIPLMTHAPYYRLVISGTKIDSLVTRSDLLKLPVRLLGFAMVTNLELLMKEIIEKQIPHNDDWMALLSNRRQNKVTNKLTHFQNEQIDPPLLELTDFCDKRSILKTHLNLPSKFERDLKLVENLRNTIAHAGNYASGETELQEFIDNLQRAHQWVIQLSAYL